LLRYLIDSVLDRTSDEFPPAVDANLPDTVT